MQLIIKMMGGFSRLLTVLGATALTGMMLLTVADVICRFFKHPIFGSVELVGFMATISVAAALPHTYRSGGHVGVEILVQLLSEKVQCLVDIVTRAVSLVLFGLITWQMFLYAGEIQRTGEVSMNLEFPIHYIIFVLALGLLAFSFTILETIVRDMIKLKGLIKK